jgi:hypothetical protein
MAAGTHVLQDCVDAFLVDSSQTLGRDTKFYPAILAFDPETMILDIGQKPSLTLDVRVRYVISCGRALARYLTYSGHENSKSIVKMQPHFIPDGVTGCNINR